MVWGESPWIVRRLPSSRTTGEGDLLQDSNGRWWQTVDRCPCNPQGTTGETCAVIINGRIYPR